MIEPPETERSLGIEAYAVDTPRFEGRLRSEPEDFRVEEVLQGFEPLESRRPGYVPLYVVEKKGVDTLHLERLLGDALGGRVSTAGLKDRRAVAIQYATPTSTRTRYPEEVKGKGFVARRVGFVPRPLARGFNLANKFNILVRGCGFGILRAAHSVIREGEEGKLPNYYGLQRFGGSGGHTHLVGRLIIKGRFDEAVDVLLLTPREGEPPEAAEARGLFSSGRFAEAAKTFPQSMDIERVVAARFSKGRVDGITALRSVPIKVRRLYVQAFQSYLFNRTLSSAMKSGEDISRTAPGDNWGEMDPTGLSLRKVHGVKETPGNNAVPLVQLVGYGSRDYGSRFDRWMHDAMADEGVEPNSFYVKEMQEVSVEGGFRKPAMVIKDAEATMEDEESLRLRFMLGKGNYATMFVREILKPEDPVSSGFA